MAEDSLSLVEARRLALYSQTFGRSGGPAASRAVLKKCLLGLGVLQIDSVNVLIRSHYLPLFSRLGLYSRECLDELTWGPGKVRLMFEYWGHEASFLPMAIYPLMTWRMKMAADGLGIYKGLADFGRDEKQFISQIFSLIVKNGPLSAGDINKGGSTGPWWGWSRGKAALEWLFAAGLISVSGRKSFERVYDLTERVIHPELVENEKFSKKEAQRALILASAKALGIATEKDLRDYYRLPAADAKAAVVDLLSAGELTVVKVEGWKQTAYALKNFKLPKNVVAATALISPFDSLIWERERTERLFNFRYRLEFYTPPAKRIYGYHVLPFLNGERLVGRVDLKAERSAGILKVLSAYSEAEKMAGEDIEALAASIWDMAVWLELNRAEVDIKGPLEKKLAAILRKISA